MKRWIFFDLGGTLIDETMQEESIVNTIVSEFARLGIAYSKLDIYEAMKDASISYESVVKGAVRKLSKTPKQYNDIIHKAVYINELELLYPHVVQVLDAIQSWDYRKPSNRCGIKIEEAQDTWIFLSICLISRSRIFKTGSTNIRICTSTS